MPAGWRFQSHRVLLLLLGADVVLIALHFLHTSLGFGASDALSMENDRGLAEIFQYLKELAIVVTLSCLAVRRRSALALRWSLLFFYLLLDDSLGIHERLGAILARLVGFRRALGLRAADFGEICISLAAGGLLLSFVALSHRRSAPPDRAWSRRLFFLVLALGFFGVAVDALHVIVRLPSVRPLLGLIEEGGEMVVMTFTAAFVLGLPARSLEADSFNQPCQPARQTTGERRQ